MCARAGSRAEPGAGNCKPEGKHKMGRRESHSQGADGFSTIELSIAMALTLVLMTVASQLVTSSVQIRNYEDRKTDAIADAQRVLNIVSREVANSGFALNDNGLVSADCGANSIRFRANLNAFSGAPAATDANDDVKFYLAQTATDSYLVRYDVNIQDVTVLGNRIDSFNVYYFDSKVTYTTDNNCGITLGAGVTQSTDKANATYIVIVTCIKLRASGASGSPGYAPAANVSVATDLTLRNATLQTY